MPNAKRQLSKKEQRKKFNSRHPEGRSAFSKKKKEIKREKMHKKGEPNW